MRNLVQHAAYGTLLREPRRTLAGVESLEPALENCSGVMALRDQGDSSQGANDVAMLISLLPVERRAILGISELADVAMLSIERVPVGVAKGVRAICRSPQRGICTLPKAVSRRWVHVTH
jgi:hypothetical protein